MGISKTAKGVLFALVYACNFLWAFLLWLCGESGNIMLGIFALIFYRLSLWLAPLAVTLLCWLPSKPKLLARTKLAHNAVCLLLCGLLFVLCNLLFGNWY